MPAGIRARARADDATCGSTDPCTATAADSCAKSRAQRRAEQCLAHCGVVRLLSTSGDAVAGETLASRIVLLERNELLVGARHHRDGRPHRRRYATAQKRGRERHGNN
jgi:hypothetical protein